MTDAATTTTSTPVDDQAEALQGALEAMKEKIVLVLTVYPIISRGMIQQGLGPGTPPRLWQPALDALIAEGQVGTTEVIKANTQGRPLTHTLYSLQTPDQKTILTLHLTALKAPPLTAIDSIDSTNPDQQYHPV